MKKILWSMFVAVSVMASCNQANSTNSSIEKEDTKNKNEVLNMTSDNSRTKVSVETSFGEIVVELYNETPKHRDNFIKLVNEKYYDGVLFHRVIKDFMIQAGDGNSKNAKAGQMLGSGDPGYTIEAEIVYPELFHKRGALAAARTGDNVNPERRSSGSQFYIVTGRKYNESSIRQMEQRMTEMKKQQVFNSLVTPHRKEIMKLRMANDTAALNKLQAELIAQTEAQVAQNPAKFTPEQIDAYTTIGGTPHLDGQYTVFGEIVKGMDVVEKIENVETGKADRPKDDVKIISMKIINK